MNSLCQQCHERPATVFLTQIVNNGASQSQLCAECARALADRDGLMLDGPNLSPNGFSTPPPLPFDEMMRSLFTCDDLFKDGGFDAGAMFPGDEDVADKMDEEDEDDPFRDAVEDSEDFDPFAAARDESNSDSALFANALDELEFENSIVCPRCGLTWERLKNEGRAGCGSCYVAFAPQLAEVMSRLQKGETHVGKIPRAREKRRRRLELLRRQRDNRLELLNTRLAEAVRQERYEDAAKLRDKIRIVASTIVRDDT